MRLINTHTHVLEQFLDSQVPEYAILSHTWGDKEVTYKDYTKTFGRLQKSNLAKIRSACRLAAGDNYSYIWIDTCCIDKRSSAELQEAINSMYRYYENAAVCYVYLADIPKECPTLYDDDPASIAEKDDHPVWHIKKWIETFQSSRWFTRGWTLQELIAPKGAVQFYSQEWTFIGDKASLIRTISSRTRIGASILMNSANVRSMSVAQRMSWAADRETSRVEDQAYSLLGLFNVNMPMLYGEGTQAFIRLQEEIIRTSTDHSILVWHNEGAPCPDGSLLATSPKNFEGCHDVVQWGAPKAFEMTNRGLRISLPTLDGFGEYSAETLAILNCRYRNDLLSKLALRLRKYGDSEEYHVVRSRPGSKGHEKPDKLRLVHISWVDLVSATPPKAIQVTRELEPETSTVKLWVRSQSGNGKIFNIVDAAPRELWDAEEGIMHVSSNGLICGGVTVETMIGNRFHVVFGLHRLEGIGEEWENGFTLMGKQAPAGPPKTYERHQGNYNQSSAISRGISRRRGFLHGLLCTPRFGLEGQSWLDEMVTVFNSRCNHQSSVCRDHGCPYLRQTAVILAMDRREQLYLKVDIAEVLEDVVVVLEIDVVGVFDVKNVGRERMNSMESERSIGSRRNPAELEANNSLQAIKESVSGRLTGHSLNRPREQIVSTIVSPLEHLLDYVEKNAAMQIWIRYPVALEVYEQPKPPRRVVFRRLDHRVLFAHFRHPYFLAWGAVAFEGQALGGKSAILFMLGNAQGERNVQGEWEVRLLAVDTTEKEHSISVFSAICEREQKSLNFERLPSALGAPWLKQQPPSVFLPEQGVQLEAIVQPGKSPKGFMCVIDLRLESRSWDSSKPSFGPDSGDLPDYVSRGVRCQSKTLMELRDAGERLRLENWV